MDLKIKSFFFFKQFSCMKIACEGVGEDSGNGALHGHSYRDMHILYECV